MLQDIQENEIKRCVDCKYGQIYEHSGPAGNFGPRVNCVAGMQSPRGLDYEACGMFKDRYKKVTKMEEPHKILEGEN